MTNNSEWDVGKGRHKKVFFREGVKKTICNRLSPPTDPRTEKTVFLQT